MPDRTIANASRPIPSDVGSMANLRGVQGWLLALCLMLTIVGPVISVWLMTNGYTTFSKHFSTSSGLRIAIYVSMALTTSSVVFGIYTGIRLWTIKPNAVNVAKNALLFGLFTRVITTAIHVAAGPESLPYAQLINQTLFHMVPSLIFFTACFAYLNKSVRVSVTFSQ